MILKVKETLKKVTIVEWIVLGIAVLALFVGLTHTHDNAKKHGKKAEKTVEAVVETK